MSAFRIKAHRGVTAAAPENTLAAFAAAKALGVEGVELDVRLSRDGVPMVHHNYYLDREESRPIFELTAAELSVEVASDPRPSLAGLHRIPTLAEVLEAYGGSLALEIELKGPELNAAPRVAELVLAHRAAWPLMEITSWHPDLLVEIADRCPGLTTALLFPLSECWMHDDVLAYAARHRALAARARAVHLHPTQLNERLVTAIRRAGVDVHAHGVNDAESLALVARLEIAWIDTDEPELALKWRQHN